MVAIYQGLLQLVLDADKRPPGTNGGVDYCTEVGIYSCLVMPVEQLINETLTTYRQE